LKFSNGYAHIQSQFGEAIVAAWQNSTTYYRTTTQRYFNQPKQSIGKF
jgi:hypothetical protein